MGFLSRIGDIAKGVARTATRFIPGPVDDLIVEGAIGGINRLTSGGRSRPPRIMRAQNLTRPNMGVPPPAIPRIPGLTGGDISVPGIDFPFVDFDANFSSGQNGLAGNVAELMGSNKIVMEPGQKVIADAPPGYVIVNMPDGSKKAVLKSVARKLGLWKPRRKPPISASDWHKLKVADRVRNKAKKIAQTADFKVTKK